jgi:hypothetical protein
MGGCFRFAGQLTVLRLKNKEVLAVSKRAFTFAHLDARVSETVKAPIPNLVNLQLKAFFDDLKPGSRERLR